MRLERPLTAGRCIPWMALLTGACASAPGAAPVETAPAATHAQTAVTSIPSAVAPLVSSAQPPDAHVALGNVSLSVIFKGEGTVSFDDLGDTLLIHDDQPARSRVYRRGTEGIVADAALVKGLAATPQEPEPWIVIGTFTGTYPDALSVDVQLRAGRGYVGQSFTRKHGRWEVVPPFTTKEYVRASVTGAIIAEAPTPEGGLLYEAVIDGKIILRRDRLKGASSRLPLSNLSAAPGCATTVVQHDRLLATPDGTVFGLGQLCTGAGDKPAPYYPAHGKLAVERWSPDGASSTVTVLPGIAEVAHGATGIERYIEGTTNDVWVQDGSTAPAAAPGSADALPYLAHFDGSTWKNATTPSTPFRLSPPTVTPRLAFVKDATLAWNGSWQRIAPGVPGKNVPYWSAMKDDGAVWAIADSRLYRLAKGSERFEEIPMPALAGAPTFPIAAHWSKSGEMLVLGTSDPSAQPNLVLSDRDARPVFVVTPKP